MPTRFVANAVFKWKELAKGIRIKDGAVEWIRTTTVLLPPAPQAGASASSATTALCNILSAAELHCQTEGRKILTSVAAQALQAFARAPMKQAQESASQAPVWPQEQAQAFWPARDSWSVRESNRCRPTMPARA
jgi:hypothetical protein